MRVFALETVLLIAFLSAGLQKPPVLHAQSETGAYSLEQGVVYKSIGEDNLKVDVCIPPQTGPFACIIYVGYGGLAAYDTSATIQAAEKGYVGVSVDYRKSGPFPVPILDIRDAILWLRANAARFKIDANRVALVGAAFGAYVSLMVTYADGSEILERNNLNQQVAAIVSLAAPSDWATMSPEQSMLLMRGYEERKKEFYQKASLLTYINRQGPPVLIIHGDADKIVPIVNAVQLDKKLSQAGVEHIFLSLHDETHEILDHWYSQEAWHFLDRHLRR